MAEGAEKKELWQRVREYWMNIDIDLSPEQLKEFYVSNLVTRTLTQLVGKVGNVSVPVEATSAGELKVATVGTGFEHNKTFPDADLSDDAWDELTFDETVSRVDVLVEGKRAKIKRTPRADDPYESEIQVPADTMYSFDCSTAKIAIKNVTSGENPTFQITGWY